LALEVLYKLKSDRWLGPYTCRRFDRSGRTTAAAAGRGNIQLRASPGDVTMIAAFRLYAVSFKTLGFEWAEYADFSV
jgi:hypothetical protein